MKQRSWWSRLPANIRRQLNHYIKLEIAARTVDDDLLGTIKAAERAKETLAKTLIDSSDELEVAWREQQDERRRAR